MTTYERIKASMIEIVERNGFATSTTEAKTGGPQLVLVEPTVEPSAPAYKLGRCPVGFCNPHTGEVAEVGEGRFCRRHYGKLSNAMAKQLAVARKLGGEKLAKQLRQAVEEIRRNDDEWVSQAVVVGGRAQAFEDWGRAAVRYYHLLAQGEEPRMISGRTGAQIDDATIREWTPHRVLDASGRIIGEGSHRSIALRNAEKRGTPAAIENLWSEETETLG